MSKNIGENVCSKYSQKHLIVLKQFAEDALKTTSKRPIQKAAEANGDLISNKILKKSQEVHHRIVQRQLKVKQKI